MIHPTEHESAMSYVLGIPYGFFVIWLLVKASGGMDWTYPKKIQVWPTIRHGNVRMRGHDDR